MTILGYHLELLQVVQVATTLVLIMIYLLHNEARSKPTTERSAYQMALLLSFLMKHLPRYATLKDILLCSDEKQLENPDNIGIVLTHMKALRQPAAGSTPAPRASFRARSLVRLLLVTPLAPLAIPLWFFATMLPSRRYRGSRIEVTEMRQNSFGMMAVAIVPSLALLFAGLLLMPQVEAIYFLVIPAGVTLLLTVICLVLIVLDQQEWKSFWRLNLLEIMALGEQKNDHNLFNRAWMVYAYFERQPDIPIPGSIGFYTVFYTAAQVIIYWAFRVTGQL